MLVPFLHNLFEEGVIEISSAVPGEGDFESDQSHVAELLTARATAIALTLPDPAPTPHLPTAVLAAKALYLAAHIYVHRESETDALLRVIPELVPQSPGSGADFGADLVLSFAPQLLKLARATASADPLVDAVTELLRPWPLSSVGVPDTTPAPDVSLTFWPHSALRALYVDRIIASGDSSRLAHPEVGEAVSAALGAHRELAPNLEI